MNYVQTYLGAPVVKAVEVHYKAVTPEAQANRCSDPPGVRSKQVPSKKAGPQGLGSEYIFTRAAKRNRDFGWQLEFATALAHEHLCPRT